MQINVLMMDVLHQLLGKGAFEQAFPGGLLAFADDDLGDVVFGGNLGDRLRNVLFIDSQKRSVKLATQVLAGFDQKFALPSIFALRLLLLCNRVPPLPRLCPRRLG